MNDKVMERTLGPLSRLAGMAAGLLVAGLLLAACDPEEQDRILLYEKGTYLGQQDEEVPPEVRQQLRDRARLQGGV